MMGREMVYSSGRSLLMDALDYKGDGEIDLILTDPPYNISRENNFKTMGRSSIDFGEWDKGFDQFTWLEVAKRSLRKGGSLIVFNDWKNVGEIAKYASVNGFEVKDLIRWEKSNPMPRNRDRRYITDFEVAVWLVKKGGKWTFNRLSDTYDRPLLKYPAPSGKKRIHPTQKPVELLVELIDRHTNPGDVVLDLFAGSGSTAVACREAKREFILCEKDEEMFKKQTEWLAGLLPVVERTNGGEGDV